MAGIPLLHVYSQSAHHDEAYVVGNAKGLSTLKDAIDRALTRKNAHADVFTADGEGFPAIVLLLPDDMASPEWTTLAEPYTSECAQDARPNAVHPSCHPSLRAEKPRGSQEV